MRRSTQEIERDGCPAFWLFHAQCPLTQTMWGGRSLFHRAKPRQDMSPGSGGFSQVTVPQPPPEIFPCHSTITDPGKAGGPVNTLRRKGILKTIANNSTIGSYQVSGTIQSELYILIHLVFSTNSELNIITSILALYMKNLQYPEIKYLPQVPGLERQLQVPHSYPSCTSSLEGSWFGLVPGCRHSLGHGWSLGHHAHTQC